LRTIPTEKPGKDAVNAVTGLLRWTPPSRSEGQTSDHRNLKMTECYDPTFMMDWENWLLARFDCRSGIPVGLERLSHPAWKDHVLNDLSNSDSPTWEEYEAYVRAGEGDEWFFDQDRPPGPEWGEGDRPPGKSGAE
jgi:hypothetical protein